MAEHREEFAREGRREVTQLSVIEGDAFALSEEDVAFVLRVLGNRLEWTREGVVIWGAVGHLLLPSGVVLSIQARKASTSCLLALASYVDPALHDLSHVRPLDHVGDEGDIGSALALLFVRELFAVTSTHGVRRRYHRMSVTSVNVRGTIDFPRLFRTGGHLAQLPCTAWERLRKTPLNQFLAAALRVIRRDSSMRAAVGGSLIALEALFVDVAPSVDPDLLAGRRPLSRDELPFASTVALARLLLRHAALTSGANRGIGFIIDIASLFERAVVKALSDAQTGVQAQHPVFYEREGQRLAYRIDAFLPVGDTLVVDAKYKSSPSSGVVQQMVTYCHLTGARSAALVFPSGQLRDLRAFELTSPSGDTMRVELVEFEVACRTVDAWRRSGEQLAAKIRALQR